MVFYVSAFLISVNYGIFNLNQKGGGFINVVCDNAVCFIAVCIRRRDNPERVRIAIPTPFPEEVWDY